MQGLLFLEEILLFISHRCICTLDLSPKSYTACRSGSGRQILSMQMKNAPLDLRGWAIFSRLTWPKRITVWRNKQSPHYFPTDAYFPRVSGKPLHTPYFPSLRPSFMDCYLFDDEYPSELPPSESFSKPHRFQTPTQI